MAERADGLSARVRACFKYGRGDHHKRCATKRDEGCDCYARRSVDGHIALDALLAELEARDKTIARAAFVAEHLFEMIDRETWRAHGGDDGQGHYEGDYRAEQTQEEIRSWTASPEALSEEFVTWKRAAVLAANDAAALRELVAAAYPGEPLSNSWRERAEGLNAWPGAASGGGSDG